MTRRDRGGWWIFVVMTAASFMVVPLSVWIGLGVEAARGVAGWEWRLEGLRRVREARTRIEAQHDPELPEIPGNESGKGRVSVVLEGRSEASLDPAGIGIAWTGAGGTVLLMADFSRDFSDNVRLHDPEFLAIPRGASLEDEAGRWRRARHARHQQREARIQAWRELASGGSEEGALSAVAGADPGFLSWLAGSFRSWPQRRGGSPSEREKGR